MTVKSPTQLTSRLAEARVVMPKSLSAVNKSPPVRCFQLPRTDLMRSLIEGPPPVSPPERRRSSSSSEFSSQPMASSSASAAVEKWAEDFWVISDTLIDRLAVFEAQEAGIVAFDRLFVFHADDKDLVDPQEVIV